jgi:outer membrane protein
LKRSFLLTAAALCALPAAGAETLADALALAYSKNPQVEAERARVRSTDENIAQARAGRLPSAQFQGDVGYRWTRQDGFFGPTETDTFPRSANISATQSLYSGGRTPALESQANALVDGASEQLRSTEQAVFLATIQSYVDVRRDLLVVDARATNVERLRKQLEAARIRFEVGEITRTDVAQAESRLAQAEAGLATARSGLETSRAAYQRVVGQAPGELEKEPAAPALPATLTQAVETGLANNPDLARAIANVRVTEALVRANTSDLNPRVDLTARIARDESVNNGRTTGTDSAQAFASVRVPLYDQGIARSRIRQSRIEVERAEFTAEDARRSVTQAVARSWGEVEATKRVIDASRTQVQAATVALEGANEELTVGLRTTLDVLDAEQELLEANLSLIAAERNAYVATHQLLSAMGILNSETLSINLSLYDPEQHRGAVRDDLWGFSTEPK